MDCLLGQQCDSISGHPFDKLASNPPGVVVVVVVMMMMSSLLRIKSMFPDSFVPKFTTISFLEMYTFWLYHKLTSSNRKFPPRPYGFSETK